MLEAQYLTEVSTCIRYLEVWTEFYERPEEM